MIQLSPDTETLARRVAAEQGVSAEDAVRQALEDHARRVGRATPTRKPKDLSEAAIRARLAHTRRIVDEVRALPVLDSRPLEEIVDDLNSP